MFLNKQIWGGFMTLRSIILSTAFFIQFISTLANAQITYLSNTTPFEVQTLIIDDINLAITKSLKESDLPLFIDKNTFNSEFDLNKHIQNILLMSKQTTLTLTELESLIPAYVQSTLKNCTVQVDGVDTVFLNYEMKVLKGKCPISYTSDYFSRTILNQRFENAMSRSMPLKNFNLKELFLAWAEGHDSNNLDKEQFLPVVLNSNYDAKSLPALLRLPRGVYYSSSDNTALEEFFSGGEAAEKSDYQNFYDLLSNSDELQFYFYMGSGNNWTNHVLVVVDSFNQAYWFSIGYSE